ncbi:MAG: PqqD family peptide modification chaperone [Microvirga sp.]|nr:PqqD family peptide modification chaperone [Microvirga sp.]
MTQPRRLSIGGVALDLRDAAPVATTLAAILRGWPMSEEDANAAATPASASVGRDEYGFRIDSPWLEEPISGLTDVEAVCSLGVDLLQGWLETRPDLLCLHCGAVEIGGRLVVFTGPSRAGKSTLAARLAAEGARLFCDDALPVDAADGCGIAPGIAPRLRLPVPERAGEALARLVAERSGPSDGRYLYLDPPGLAPRGERAPVGAILLLDRREDGPAQLLAARPEDALRLLVSQNLARDLDPALIVDRMAAMHARAPCMRLVYSDLDEAAATIFAAFAHPGAIHRPDGPAEPFEPWRGREGAGPAEPIDRSTRYLRSANVAVRRLGDGLFLCDPREQSILHLNALGAGLWRLLDEPVSPDEAAGAVGDAFPDVARERITEDVTSLFSALAARGLITATA